MVNKKLLIIAPYQFGELSDCYYWAKYMTQIGWDVTYFGYKYCGERALRSRTCKGVKVLGIRRYNNRYVLGFLFYINLIWKIWVSKFNHIIICNMPYAQLLPRIFPHRDIILDTRTLSVSSDEQTRKIQNQKLKNIAQQFKRRSFISEGVKKQLGFRDAESYILPLGAELISLQPKRFDQLRLIYIGTFDNRNLADFIKGLYLFKKKFNIEISFDIVGSGKTFEEQAIKQAIDLAEDCDIRLHGYLTHDQVKKLFDKCNIGVCYVPITEYYHDQPPTKLYEYLLSGMACIATKTRSNTEVLTEQSGVLIDDTPQAVCDGLHIIYERMKKYNSKQIVNQNMKFHWKNIISHYLLHILNK